MELEKLAGEIDGLLQTAVQRGQLTEAQATSIEDAVISPMVVPDSTWRISRVIERLKALKAEHGDIPCYFSNLEPYSDDFVHLPIEIEDEDGVDECQPIYVDRDLKGRDGAVFPIGVVF